MTNRNAATMTATATLIAACRAGAHTWTARAARERETRACVPADAPRGTLTRALALVEAAHTTYAARAQARANARRDRLAQREPGNVPARAIRRALGRAYYEANFRACAEHEVTFRVDSPRAESRRSQCWANQSSSIRYPNAYKWPVSCSAHEIASNSTVFAALRAYPPRPGRAVIGRDAGGRWVLVRQGRGSGLVVEYRRRLPRV